MKRTGILLIIAIVILGGLGFAPNRDGRSDRKQFRQKMMADLKLTDAQKDQISKLRFEHQKSVIDSRARTQKAKLDLRELMQADKPDRASIDKSLKVVSEAQLHQKSLWVDHWFAVRSVLTPEQQELWKDAPLMGPRGDRNRHRGGDSDGRGHEDEDSE